MAAVVQSKTNVVFSNASSITFTPPSGIADGDLLFCVIGWEAAGASITTVPSGWTELRHEGRTNIATWIFWKVASSESGNYIFGWPGSGGRRNSGVMMRISGVSNTFVSATGTADNTATPSIANGITPSIADSLLVMCFGGEQNNNNVDTYAIVTSNPTWTEQHDEVDGGASFSLAVATATRTAVTDTGNTSIAGGDSTGDWVGHLVSINLPINVTVSPAVIEATVSVQDPTVTGGAVVSPAVIELTASVQNPIVTTPAAKWTNQDKSAPSSFTNQDKS